MLYVTHCCHYSFEKNNEEETEILQTVVA